MSGVDLRTTIAVLIWAACSAAGDLLLSRSRRQMPPFAGFQAAELPRFLQYTVTAPAILIGTALLAVGFASFLALLRWAELSVAAPAGASSYLFITPLARWLLGEQIPPLRWLGVLLVTLGVALVLASQGSWFGAGNPRGRYPEPGNNAPPHYEPGTGEAAWITPGNAPPAPPTRPNRE